MEDFDYKELINELSHLQHVTKKKVNCKNDFMKWARENKYELMMCEKLITYALKENDKYKAMIMQIDNTMHEEEFNIINNKRINEIKSILKIN